MRWREEFCLFLDWINSNPVVFLTLLGPILFKCYWKVPRNWRNTYCMHNWYRERWSSLGHWELWDTLNITSEKHTLKYPNYSHCPIVSGVPIWWPLSATHFTEQSWSQILCIHHDCIIVINKLWWNEMQILDCIAYGLFITFIKINLIIPLNSITNSHWL